MSEPSGSSLTASGSTLPEIASNWRVHSPHGLPPVDAPTLPGVGPVDVGVQPLEHRVDVALVEGAVESEHDVLRVGHGDPN